MPGGFFRPILQSEKKTFGGQKKKGSLFSGPYYLSIILQTRYIKIAIQETQIQALQQSLQEIEDEAVLQKENNKLVDGLVRERNDLKQLVQKLSEQLGNLSAEQSLQNSRVSSPT